MVELPHGQTVARMAQATVVFVAGTKRARKGEAGLFRGRALVADPREFGGPSSCHGHVWQAAWSVSVLYWVADNYHGCTLAKRQRPWVPLPVGLFRSEHRWSGHRVSVLRFHRRPDRS